MILILSVLWLWRFIVPVFDWFLSFFVPQIIAYVREEMKKTSISEQTMIGIVWTSVMSSVEWNKKEELVTEQAIKLLKVSMMLLKGSMICNTYQNTASDSSYSLCSNTAHCWRPSPPRACLSSPSCWRSRSTATTISTSWRPSRRSWCFFTKVCLW